MQIDQVRQSNHGFIMPVNISRYIAKLINAICIYIYIYIYLIGLPSCSACLVHDFKVSCIVALVRWWFIKFQFQHEFKLEH